MSRDVEKDWCSHPGFHVDEEVLQLAYPHRGLGGEFFHHLMEMSMISLRTVRTFLAWLISLLSLHSLFGVLNYTVHMHSE